MSDQHRNSPARLATSRFLGTAGRVHGPAASAIDIIIVIIIAARAGG